MSIGAGLACRFPAGDADPGVVDQHIEVSDLVADGDRGRGLRNRSMLPWAFR